MVRLTGFARADLVVCLAIARMMVPRTPLLLRDTLGVLMGNAPREVEVPKVRAAIAGVPGVLDVHELHVWTITSGQPPLTSHISVAPGSAQAMLPRLQELVAGLFGITHAAFQLEPPGLSGRELLAHP